MSKLCYLTGVPGVGKTTLGRALAAMSPSTFTHLSFGRLIASALESGGVNASERDLRVNSSRLVTANTLQLATSLLFEQIETNKNAAWIVVDSHAASQDWFGFVATPDNQSYFSRVRYDAIIHLYAEPDIVLSRSMQEVTGRRAQKASDLVQHENILRSITVLYSCLSSCPAYFVSAEAPTEILANTVRQLLVGERA